MGSDRCQESKQDNKTNLNGQSYILVMPFFLVICVVILSVSIPCVHCVPILMLNLRLIIYQQVI